MWGDGIENANPKNKSADYTVAECDTDASLVLPYAETQRMYKKSRSCERWGYEVKICGVGRRNEYMLLSAPYYPPPTTSKHHGEVVQQWVGLN